MNLGLGLLSAQNIIDFAKQTNNTISNIKQSEESGDFITDGKYSYLAIHKDNVKSASIAWLKGIGDATYFLTNFIFRENTKVVNALGHLIIEDTAKFLNDAINFLEEDYKDYKEDYPTFKEYLMAIYELSIEDLLDIKKVWESEVLYIGTAKNFTDEMLPHIKKYTINEEAVFGEIRNSVFKDYEMLGDYGLSGVYTLDDIIIFKRDI